MTGGGELRKPGIVSPMTIKDVLKTVQAGKTAYLVTPVFYAARACYPDLISLPDEFSHDPSAPRAGGEQVLPDLIVQKVFDMEVQPHDFGKFADLLVMVGPSDEDAIIIPNVSASKIEARSSTQAGDLNGRWFARNAAEIGRVWSRSLRVVRQGKSKTRFFEKSNVEACREFISLECAVRGLS